MQKAFYCKTIENAKNRQDIEIDDEEDRYIHLVQINNFELAIQIDDF